MSDAAETPTAEAPAAGSALEAVAEGGAPAAGADSPTPEAGQGEGAAASGQGAGDGEVLNGDAPAEGDKPGGEEGAGAQGAPENYADFTLPDGYEIQPEMLAAVTTLAKAHNMTQEQAQAVVDLGVAQANTIVDGFVADARENPVPLAKFHETKWSEQTAADTELGGPKLKTTMALVNKVFDTFGTDALGEFLNKTGIAHHPELVRFMNAVGKAVSEDTLVTRRGGTESKRPGGVEAIASRLYPGMN